MGEHGQRPNKYAPLMIQPKAAGDLEQKMRAMGGNVMGVDDGVQDWLDKMEALVKKTAGGPVVLLDLKADNILAENDGSLAMTDFDPQYSMSLDNLAAECRELMMLSKLSYMLIAVPSEGTPVVGVRAGGKYPFHARLQTLSDANPDCRTILDLATDAASGREEARKGAIEGGFAETIPPPSRERIGDRILKRHLLGADVPESEVSSALGKPALLALAEHHGVSLDPLLAMQRKPGLAINFQEYFEKEGLRALPGSAPRGFLKVRSLLDLAQRRADEPAWQVYSERLFTPATALHTTPPGWTWDLATPPGQPEDKPVGGLIARLLGGAPDPCEGCAAP